MDANTNIEVVKMTVSLTLFWLLLGGAIGGILDFFNRFKLEIENGKVCFQGAYVSISQIFSLGVMNASLGVGGALAVQFAMLSIGKFQTNQTVESQLLLLTISVVSGFGGRRFLSLVSSKLEDQIGEANRRSEEAKEEAEESLTLSKALATLRVDATASERVEAITALEKYLKLNPTNRSFAILVGRLHRTNKDYQHAIDVLSQFINSKGNNRDDDYADALYNRACYKVLLAHKGANNANNETINDALRDLKKSIEISPGNATDALSDKDFDKVYENDEFIKITNKKSDKP